MADFFDKLRDGVNKGVATVSTVSKTVLEKSKINSVIKTLKDEKQQLAEIIGNKVYKYMCENPGDIPRSELESICAEISARIDQINAQNERLAQLDDEMSKIVGSASIVPGLCTCGQQNAQGAKFCVVCGKKL